VVDSPAAQHTLAAGVARGMACLHGLSPPVLPRSTASQQGRCALARALCFAVLICSAQVLHHDLRTDHVLLAVDSHGATRRYN
jgi:hypothetical protein